MADPKFKSKKSWRSKIENTHPPKIEEIPPNWEKSMGKGMMVIANPKLFKDVVEMIPRGHVVTMSDIRAKFAHDFKVQGCCPLTTGIFLRIVAEAAEEARDEGREKDICPYWRVVRDDGSFIEKFPGGPAAQIEKLQAEKIPVHQVKKKLVVDLIKAKRFYF